MSTIDLPALFIELNENGQKGDFSKAVKVADKILKEDKNNAKALHYKIVCLIKLRHIDDALQAIQNSDANIQKDLQYEKAYCLYRKGKANEALDVLKTMKESTEVKELRAQSLYLIGQFQEAYTTYVDVLKNSLDENEAKREANLAAVVAALKLSGGKVTGDIPDILDDIVSSVDVTALESSCWSLSSKTKYIKKAVTRADGKDATSKRKKKKRKKIMPKKYDLNVDPDPERWLPRWQRSATKKKTDKRKNRDAVGKGTQGGTSDNVTTSESFAKSSPKPGSANPTPNPRQSKPAGKAGKGSKGKGKRR